MTSRAVKLVEAPGSRYETERVGARLREIRLTRGLTISRLAKLSSVPGSTISKIENGQLKPSLVSAIRLASALEENLGFLVDRYRANPQARVVVREGERSTIEYPDMGLTLQDMSGHFEAGVLEARVGLLAPNATSGVDPMTHDGDEFCLVVEGAIRYRIGERNVELAEGEYIQFRSSMRHSWENASDGETRVLWVFSDGLSF